MGQDAFRTNSTRNGQYSCRFPADPNRRVAVTILVAPTKIVVAVTDWVAGGARGPLQRRRPVIDQKHPAGYETAIGEGALRWQSRGFLPVMLDP
jgi:hypothetical protein